MSGDLENYFPYELPCGEKAKNPKYKGHVEKPLQ